MNVPHHAHHVVPYHVGPKIALCVAAVAAASAAAEAQVLLVGRLPPLPQAISNNAVTSVSNPDGSATLYSFMGITDPLDAASITAASFRLELPGGSWTRIADAPRLNDLGKIGANAVNVAGQVYLIGGYSVAGTETTEPRLFRYNHSTDDYTELARVPFEVDDTVAAVYHDRYIFLTSGWHGPANNNIRRVQVYDTRTDTWEQATPLPGPGRGLFGHAGTIIDNRLVIADGVRRAGLGFGISDRVYQGHIDPDNAGDVTNIAWQSVDPHPGQPTYRAAASQLPTADGRLLLVGGTENPYNFTGTGYNGQPSLPLAQFLAYQPEELLWTELVVRGDPIATMDHRGLVQAGRGWATIGGMTSPGVASEQVVYYEFVPEPGGVYGFLFALTMWGLRSRPEVTAGGGSFSSSPSSLPTSTTMRTTKTKRTNQDGANREVGDSLR